MALVSHSGYRVDRNIGGMGDLDGFFGDVWGGVKKGAQVVVNVGRIMAVPVTGGASLLIPKAKWANKPAAPPPAEVNPEWTAAIQEVAHQVAETTAPLQSYTASSAPRGYLSPQGQPQVQPLSAGQYLVPPGFGQLPQLPPPSTGLPSWLLPVGLGAGALTVIYLVLRKPKGGS